MNLQTDGYREFAWKFAYEFRHFSQRIQRSRADLGHLSLQLPNEPLTMQSAHCKLHVNVLERVGWFQIEFNVIKPDQCRWMKCN